MIRTLLLAGSLALASSSINSEPTLKSESIRAKEIVLVGADGSREYLAISVLNEGAPNELVSLTMRRNNLVDTPYIQLNSGEAGCGIKMIHPRKLTSLEISMDSEGSPEIRFSGPKDRNAADQTEKALEQSSSGTNLLGSQGDYLRIGVEDFAGVIRAK